MDNLYDRPRKGRLHKMLSLTNRRTPFGQLKPIKYPAIDRRIYRQMPTERGVSVWCGNPGSALCVMPAIQQNV